MPRNAVAGSRRPPTPRPSPLVTAVRAARSGAFLGPAALPEAA
ncbi:MULTISPECIES: hypothetical protein [unclassified Kitasatospora]